MIEVEHNGYAITYSENEDLWRCWGLDMDAKTLSALRTKINQWDADKRRLGNIPVLKISKGYFESKVYAEATAVMLDADGKSVWVYGSVMKHGQRGDRSKLGFDQVLHDTPENRAKLDEIAKLEDRRRELATEVAAIRGTLEHVTVETFRSLGQAPDAPPARKRMRR